MAQGSRPPGWDRRSDWVVADRDGDALVELDRDLFVIASRPLRAPLAVRAGGGEVWVVHAPDGSPDPPLALLRWGSGGAGPGQPVGDLLGLEVDGLGRAWVLERGSTVAARLLRCEAGRSACDLEAPAQASALALGAGGPAVALGEAGWATCAADGTWTVRPGLEGGDVVDLAARPDGGWWMLVRLPGERETLRVDVDASGTPRAVEPAGASRRLARRTLAPWSFECDARALRGPAAAGGREVALALYGARAALGDGEGGLLVAAAGALLRLDASGAALPGQGGFARLVDVERLAP